MVTVITACGVSDCCRPMGSYCVKLKLLQGGRYEKPNAGLLELITKGMSRVIFIFLLKEQGQI